MLPPVPVVLHFDIMYFVFLYFMHNDKWIPVEFPEFVNHPNRQII